MTTDNPTINLPDSLKPGKVNLVGVDGNAFAVMGTVRRALRRADNTPEDTEAVMDAMQAGDYNHLLAVAITATVEPESEFDDD